MINQAITKLISYALQNNLIEYDDKIWAINGILEVLKLDDFALTNDEYNQENLASILDILLDDAFARGVILDNSIVSRDLLDTAILGKLTPRPSCVLSKFSSLYNDNPKDATDWFYKFSKDVNYIRRDRISRDLKWFYESEYGVLDMSINLSKPEFDIETIKAMRNMPQGNYPICPLCAENVGFSGNFNHAARQNLRIIPINLQNTPSFFQFSPYVYFNEHCIIFSKEHTPMKINRDIFEKLLSFASQFPHYFVGANADLPIVGGSIATHDHFQGGNYSFAMMKAEIEREIVFSGFEDLKCGIVKWPLSVIRIKGSDAQKIVNLADKILQKWKNYSDESAEILSHIENTRHNTITPIVRTENGDFIIELILRNNRTSDAHPLGIFHAHEQYHNIKIENIGLIEAIGHAILPPRLKKEFTKLSECLANGVEFSQDETLKKHVKWVNSFKNNYVFTSDNSFEILQAETGKVFEQILHNCGVFKRNEQGLQAFLRFIDQI